MSASAVFNLRVNAVRSLNPYGRGGAIFTGIEVDVHGQRIDAKAHHVVIASNHLLSAPVERGQLWRVSGVPQSNTIVVNGYSLTESTITPEAMELLRPSGEHIVTLLAEGEAFSGIGQVKARRLWDHFGQELYGILDRGDVSKLNEALPLPMAGQLADAWGRWGDGFTLQWLQSKGFPVALGRKVLAYFGRTTAARIEEDPYRLLSFASSWETVDALAQETFGVARDDPRRLAGGVEEALYAAFDAGHTCLDRTAFNRCVRGVLGPLGEMPLQSAIKAGLERGSFIVREDRFHAPGPYLMENTVAAAIADRVRSRALLLGEAELRKLITAYDSEARLEHGDAAFNLNVEQCEALAVANAWAFAVITGGAGTGKTTVLRALFRVFAAAGHEIFAMALSGRAAKRISEATGHKARTIAGFLRNFTPEDVPAHAVVVIDEASMVDLPSIYRVIRHLPSHFRIVLVGDPHQLPPVGPGLLLHELAHGDGVPVVELKDVRRHGGSIARAAALIRSGQWPDPPASVDADIAFLPCEPERINDMVLRVYDEDRGASQILCSTRNAAAGGAKSINALCQQRFNTDGQKLMLWNPELDQAVMTGFRVGDPVICVKNDWEIDLQNGSLGVITSVEAPAADDDPTRVLGKIRWDDGKIRDLTFELLGNIELAYAITIHKSQGSAFHRVIMPVTQTRLLDRTLLYTAVTRAESQVILVGDETAARRAVLAPRRSDERQVALGVLLRGRMGNERS